MKIEQIISDAAVKAVKALYGIEAAPGTTVPQKTKKEFEGNLTLVVFPFLKASHKAPEATAQEIGEYLLANEPAVASFNVIKGFLNLVIAPSFWSQMLHHIDEEADFGTHKAAADAPLVMVEYSSPNTNKPLHLGHVRNNLLGYSLSEILKANGNRVVKTNIVNDRGIHICKSTLPILISLSNRSWVGIRWLRAKALPTWPPEKAKKAAVISPVRMPTFSLLRELSELRYTDVR